MKKSLFRTALCTSSALVAVAAVAAPAYAQVDDQQEQAVEEEILEDSETIVITGSRISNPEVTAVSPVQVIGEEIIEDSGVTNVQELLLENPAFGTPALSRTNSAFLTSGTGVATVDLRDLGSDRTLVLINGRRVVAGVSGTSIVDLNVIPTQFIERVDVLTGGASAIYGSDAVAGVVNFIYKDDFEGVEAQGQYGITEEGDDARYQLNLTMGSNFDDGRGNIIIHGGYSNEEGLLSRQRQNTFLDDADTFAFFTANPDDFGTPTEPFFSSGPPQGRFDVNGTATSSDDFTFDPVTGALRPCFSANGGTCSNPAVAGSPFEGTAIGPDGFNRQFFRTLAVPVERYLFAARGTYEFTDNVNVFFEGTYSKTTSSREIEPFFLSSEDIFPSSAGRVPIETLVRRDTDGDGDIDADDGTELALNPIVPGPIAAAATDTDGDGIRDIGFIRRIVEFGPRQGSTTRDMYRFVVGLNGSIFDDRFNWDVYYNFGQTTENQASSGQVNVLNFRNALAAVTDVDDLDNDGDTTDVVCADADARDQGCVPVNVFGAGNISQAAVNYINAESSFQTDITQQVVGANLSGELFELPAGGVYLAVGGEYREEDSTEELDALTNAGLNAGNALPDTEGSFDVVEGYAEINVPILADVPFFYELGVQAAGRVSDYSTVGTVYTYTGGVEWAPVPDIRLRGSYSRSVRAPNVGELFTGPSQTFPSGLTDPCVGVGPTGGGTTGDICRSDPGVAANIAANGVFTLNQPDLQGISGFNSGNPDLSEEESDSYTIGAVINPTSIDALRNLVITVDYYNIDIEGAIVQPPRQFILDQCFSGADTSFCDQIIRRPQATSQNSAGSIDEINASVENTGGLSTEGIDVVASYRFGLDDLIGAPGSISARVAYTHIFDWTLIPVPGADPDPADGEIGTAADRFTANLAYQGDRFGISFTGTFIGESSEDDQLLSAFEAFGCGPPCVVDVPAQFYLDTQLKFDATDEAQLYFGVDNLLDNDAPNILTGTTFNVTGTDTAADVYDIFGRRYYAGVRLRF